MAVSLNLDRHATTIRIHLNQPRLRPSILQLTLVLLSALLSFSIASPTLQRRGDCVSDDDCDLKTHCDTHWYLLTSFHCGLISNQFCVPLFKRALAIRQDGAQTLRHVGVV
jgi:hypothetical protein